MATSTAVPGLTVKTVAPLSPAAPTRAMPLVEAAMVALATAGTVSVTALRCQVAQLVTAPVVPAAMPSTTTFALKLFVQPSNV